MLILNTREFFELLYPNFDTNKNLIEIRPVDIKTGFPKNRKFCISIDEIVSYSKWLDDQRQYHIFFECPELKPGSTSGEEAQCFRYPFLYSDMDPVKKDDDGNIVETYTKEQLYHRAKSFPLPPTVIVDSGSGLHVYWVLDVPLYDKDTLKYVLTVIQEQLGGDKKAKLATQLLRIPYTHNLKHLKTGGEALEVKIIESNSNKYSIKDFLNKLNISAEDIKKAATTPQQSSKKVKTGKVVNSDGISFDFSKKPKPLNIKIDNFPDLLDTLKKQNILQASNMANYTLGKTFRCCFHDDENPSANVFLSSNGYYYYKCFGCSRVYDIITIYQNIKKVTFPKAILELCDYYGIDFKYQDWIINQLEKYYHNAALIERFEEFEYHTMYPNLYSLLKPRFKYLSLINHYGLARLSSNRYSYENEGLFFFSYDYFANRYGKEYHTTLTTLFRSVNLFATLRLIRKVPISEVPSHIAAKAIEQTTKLKASMGKRVVEPVNFYTIPNLHDNLQVAEERARILIEHKFTITKCMNKIFLIKVFGQEVADEVYPDERTITKKSLSLANRLESTLVKLISEQGYATKDMIVSKTKVSGRLKADRKTKERELDRNLSIYLTAHNLEYVKANKNIKEMFGLKTSVFVIVPKGIR